MARPLPTFLAALALLGVSAAAAQAASYTSKTINPNGSLGTMQGSKCNNASAASHFAALKACIESYGTPVPAGTLAMTAGQTFQSTYKVVQVGATNPRWGYRTF